MKVYLNDPIEPSAYARLKSHVEIISNFDHPEELAGMHVAGSTNEALERNGKAVVDSVFEVLGIDG